MTSSSKKEKAPTWHGDAFSDVENALLRGAVDAKAEIERRFPRGKTPTYAKRWRELGRLLQKQRLYDQALTAVDRLRKEPAAPSQGIAHQDRGPQAPQTNGGSHHDGAIAASPL